MQALVAFAAGVVAAAGTWTAAAASSPSPVPSPTDVPTPQTTRTPVPSGAPWWVPIGLRGRSVTAVAARGPRIAVTAAGADLVSDDGGTHFTAAPCTPSACVPGTDGPTVAGATAVVRTPSEVFAIRDGRVLHGVTPQAPTPDPGSPDLGGTARLIAAPASLTGTAVAVGADGTVWRRSPSGDWSRALLLLPQGLTRGPPRVTTVTAFTERPLSRAIYLGTDGYSMLQSDNGGDDWIRAGPGLPDHVLALSADASAQALYAGTDDGLWVHLLRVEPAPPDYPDAELLARWLGIAAVCAAGCAASVVLLRAALR